MNTRRMRNSTKRGLVYLFVLLLYLIVFANILVQEKPVEYRQSGVVSSHKSS